MRDALSGRNGDGAPEPPPTPPGPPPTITPADSAAPDPTDAPGDDSSRPSPRSSRPTSSKPPLNNLHGSPSTENRHSSKNPGIARKTHNRPAAPSSSNVQYPRTAREEPRTTRERPSGGARRARRAPIRARFAPIGSEAPADREKWRSGRIVPPRTRRPPRLNRGIMRMTPDVFDVRTRTILPERQNRAREPDKTGRVRRPKSPETGWGRRPDHRARSPGGAVD